jgi:hypothetical protein
MLNTGKPLMRLTTGGQTTHTFRSQHQTTPDPNRECLGEKTQI